MLSKAALIMAFGLISTPRAFALDCTDLLVSWKSCYQNPSLSDCSAHRYSAACYRRSQDACYSFVLDWQDCSRKYGSTGSSEVQSFCGQEPSCEGLATAKPQAKSKANAESPTAKSKGSAK